MINLVPPQQPFLTYFILSKNSHDHLIVTCFFLIFVHYFLENSRFQKYCKLSNRTIFTNKLWNIPKKTKKKINR